MMKSQRRDVRLKPTIRLSIKRHIVENDAIDGEALRDAAEVAAPAESTRSSPTVRDLRIGIFDGDDADVQSQVDHLCCAFCREPEVELCSRHLECWAEEAKPSPYYMKPHKLCASHANIELKKMRELRKACETLLQQRFGTDLWNQGDGHREGTVCSSGSTSCSEDAVCNNDAAHPDSAPCTPLAPRSSSEQEPASQICQRRWQASPQMGSVQPDDYGVRVLLPWVPLPGVSQAQDSDAIADEGAYKRAALEHKARLVFTMKHLSQACVEFMAHFKSVDGLHARTDVDACLHSEYTRV